MEESVKKGNHHHHSLWHGGGSQPQNHKEEIEGLRTVSYREAGRDLQPWKVPAVHGAAVSAGCDPSQGIPVLRLRAQQALRSAAFRKRRFDASDLDLAGGGTAAEEDRKMECVFIGSGLDAEAPSSHDLDSCRQDVRTAPGATTGEEEGERRVRDASELRGVHIEDVRFQVEAIPSPEPCGALSSFAYGTPGGTACPSRT